MAQFGLNIQTDLLPRTLPRTWFISGNDEHVIQLQVDRLIVNWRMRPGGGAYPRYQEVRQRFVAAHDVLNKFVHLAGYPHPIPNQCDLTYFNKVPLPEDAEWADIDRLLSGMKLRIGPEWSGTFEDCLLAFGRSLRHHGEGSFGRLLIECRPILMSPTEKAWALNLTVRGRPVAQDFHSVVEFFDRAHIEIVTSFTAITTEVMHKIWGRRQ
jgi:uncharacterized protein (TIGR04255 family)